jgi:gluconate 2-dehydrogenase gamma chain
VGIIFATMRGVTRRDWILGAAGFAAWPAIASAHEHALKSAASPSTAAFGYFNSPAARDVAAIAARIIPSDDAPGATEAGVIWFIDRALQTFDSDQQVAYRDGLADLDLRRRKSFPGSASFADLTAAGQIQLLHAIEETDFFGLIRRHTVLAWLGSPEYGGNRGSVGWNYIGFEDHGAFLPPFGYYDGDSK